MRLTYHTDYALRMLVYLALNRGRPSRVGDVAESYGISRNHLLKVALDLGRLGYLTSVRGRSGGIALARNPEDQARRRRAADRKRFQAGGVLGL